jgi:hypothetical protein
MRGVAVVAQAARYLVLGRTRGRASIHMIGRYKGEGDLRDVFVTQSIPKSRALGLYVFELVGVASTEDVVWHIISFDISRAKGGRKPGYEYSYIKDMLLLRLCASIDSSTYICPEDYSKLLRDYLDQVSEDYRLESYTVRTFRDKERELLKEAFTETLEYVLGALASLRDKVVELKSRRINKALKNVARKAERVARTVEEALSRGDNAMKVSLALRRSIRSRVEEAVAGLRRELAAQ